MSRFGWTALAVSGFVFWFVLGFPFGHHNESYDWVAWIDVPDPTSVTWRQFFGSGGYRPLAMTTAWASYRWSSGSLVPIQLFNFLVTIAAWVILARAVPERRTFAIAALLVGGALFAGYIYLFHLHGVFYGPMLLWLALAVRLVLGRPTPRGYGITALFALVAATFHPYTLVFCLALVIAAPFEFGWIRDKRAIALVGLLAAGGAALILFATPERFAAETDVKLKALTFSLLTLEVARPVSAVAAALALATAWTTHWPRASLARVAVAVAGVTAVGMLVLGGPVVLVWFAAAMVKLWLHRRWTLAALLFVSFGLPFAGGTGSPTYAVFAVALATVALAVDADAIEHWFERVPDRMPAADALGILALAIALRAGAELPVVSSVVRPVIAERERTHQLERLLDRLLDSPYRTAPVVLADAAASPVESGGKRDRSERSPTQQVCLDAYLAHVRGEPDPALGVVTIAFGRDESPLGTPWVERSQYAGEAVAILPPAASAGTPDSTADTAPGTAPDTTAGRR